MTLQPIIFSLMFTYLFGGAIAGNVPHYLPTIRAGAPRHGRHLDVANGACSSGRIWTEACLTD